MIVPPPESVNFREYGLKHIETLLNIFTISPMLVVNWVIKQQLQAELGKCKFDLLEWKKLFQRMLLMLNVQLWLPQHGHFIICWNSCPTARHFYPLLSNLAECCLSIPISNAWPECGASALNTRLRSRLQNDMLQALNMQVSINGPPLHSDLHSFGWSRRRGEPCLRKEHQQITVVLCASM